MALRMILAAAALVATAASAAVQPRVAIDAGALEGTEEHGIAAFRGIPYAQPPIGQRRWRAPSPAAAWTGRRRADRFAPACQQGPAARPIEGTLPPSEDCLYLNVWKPADAPAGARLPVLVWIHGGAFRAGATSDPRIEGDRLARRGIVVVSVAYRLGVFGFLAHPALSAETPHHVSGNYGLRDQIAALRWVQRNIGAFGGDPAKVTIGGMSAGAISAAMLAAAPEARGLFRGIISMSGGSFAPPRSPAEAGENVEPLANAERNGTAFGYALGATDAAELRALPANRILAAEGRGVSWPIIDNAIILGDEYPAFAARRIADVPLLLGTAANEGFAFSRVTTLSGYRDEIGRRFGSFAPAILAAYPATTDAEATQQARDVLREVMFGWGTWAWADQASRYGTHPVYAYYWNHGPPDDGGQPAGAGAAHGSDQPYPFGIDHLKRAWTAADHLISDAMLGYFANFVKTGNPNGVDLPAWPVFTATGRQNLHFDDGAITPGTVANGAKVDLIDRYMAVRREQGQLGAPR